ncbi:calcium channel subunit Mid1 [Pyrenophora tritici-repentis]|uniref:Calcium influx-promoting protein ehs1 n=2 Tax=Pyrenophora tritici-repentis TaxID=45151 RepID=A0A2W1G496_9PLEO|nr:Calcium influx-promoting protein ehs1 [Pyrenophora tritici-repentis]KAF7448680.1 Calcium influx-promoting protein ehs1 [Pyrenophora tritici-repentis]KAI0576162.1 Calcium influx-promoting protein ehs1 [Pyrenophora tritici-repentis]KAI0577946.1 Calcium influx-promoting protein ehs1 [Pyrenophora tritici-repentis]KAI0606916.1 Calcium influx-promoting protein ehs1 [Pyrenophora tritici-repentis]
MQRPKLSPLQSRLLAYLVASSACLALWTSFTPHLLVNAEVLTIPNHDALDGRVLDALTDGELPHIQDAGFDQRGSEGYEPDFGILDRSLIGRQTAEIERLVVNQKMAKDIAPRETVHFVLQRDQLRFPSINGDSASAPEARGMNDGSDEARLRRLEVAGTEGTTPEGMEKRQTRSGNIWLTANTCKQPMPMGNATAASGRNHPQLVMYVSTSPDNQKPGPGATENTLTNITGVLFDGGYANFELNTSSDVYIGISAPSLNDDWFGSWHFELAASTDGPYHNYNDDDPFLYMVDTDSESALFITYDLGDSNETEVVNKWKEQNPFQMYAFMDGDNTPIRGMERSYCAIKDMFNVNNTKNFTIDSSITTKFGGDNKPKTQFHVKGLQAARTYNGFVVVEGSQEPLYIPNAGMTRGGGRVFQAFNWTTKADDSCQVIFDLDFCDKVAYAVPSNTNFKLNDSALAEIYDNQARDYYLNFTRSLSQIACDTEPAAQYSLARTCDDCERDYKNWLCMVLIPRCEDWTANDPWLQPRNVNTPFSNGSLPMDGLPPPPPDGSMAPAPPQINDTLRQHAGFNSSRNPRIDELIKPGPYKEMKPCEDMCFDIVRSCPSKLGFGCPDGKLRDVAYGKRDPDPNKLTCNFPGAVVKLNAPSGAGRLGVGLGCIVFLVGLTSAVTLV